MTRGEAPTVVVCGLGPGDDKLLTEQTVAVLDGPDPVYLRTRRHPSASRLSGAPDFDEVYERAATFDDVYQSITATLIEAADHHGRVVYCVPGSPLILERSVAQLRGCSEVAVELLPAVSFLDEVWARLEIDPVEHGVRLIDGHRFGLQAAGQSGPLLVAHAHAEWVLSEIKLALLEASDADPDQPVIVLQRLGTPTEQIIDVTVADLDRKIEPDHLTTLYLPSVATPVGAALLGSVELMRRLRTECPWDRAQSHTSLRRYLLEETYEVLDALDRLAALDAPADGSWSAETDDALLAINEDLESELGDLLFQILFHSRLASEAGAFDIASVAETLIDKMVHRHPHVFGSIEPTLHSRAGGSEEDASTEDGWNRVKAAETGRASILDGIPRAMPSLARAAKVLKRMAAEHGSPELANPRADMAFLLGNTEAPEAAGTVDGSTTETETRLGELLLLVVELARRQGLDADQALREATRRVEAMVRDHERGQRDNRDLPAFSWVLG